jgi:hypothetical protein
MNIGSAVPWSVPAEPFWAARRPNSEKVITTTSSWRPRCARSCQKAASASESWPISLSCCVFSLAWVSKPPVWTENRRVPMLPAMTWATILSWLARPLLCGYSIGVW